jgi:hypothetical protein
LEWSFRPVWTRTTRRPTTTPLSAGELVARAQRLLERRRAENRDRGLVERLLRTITGAEQFHALRAYLGTAAKNGRSHVEALTALANRRPGLPAT